MDTLQLTSNSSYKFKKTYGIVNYGDTCFFNSAFQSILLCGLLNEENCWILDKSKLKPIIDYSDIHHNQLEKHNIILKKVTTLNSVTIENVSSTGSNFKNNFKPKDLIFPQFKKHKIQYYSIYWNKLIHIPLYSSDEKKDITMESFINRLFQQKIFNFISKLDYSFEKLAIIAVSGKTLIRLVKEIDAHKTKSHFSKKPVAAFHSLLDDIKNKIKIYTKLQAINQVKTEHENKEVLMKDLSPNKDKNQTL
ncbi:hypothetical protein DICPUDRAFT_157790 [Dictyostelium purpureum]|uniref:Uncharacterized protein n=1 Tax=Dictyostelium purpureum TaxID=5786 RepID=F1A004_DICPU|nr:uncharacterized protein DICPUDRAFT_157790 [Dictyostelium purpureum]EGC30468.1 hypothetical protein DICPUDRAFT_157790 [Dictyostelium purpureum]|eukprot:XP_003292997.1 hypothetical protein DICPUDRAFT_157790 [Dictyostelium purpureum]